MTYAGLVSKGIIGLAFLADVTRCVYNTVEAKELTDDAGMDVGADIAECVLAYQGIETLGLDKSLQNDAAGVRGVYAQACFAVVYTTIVVITTLEQLNGWGSLDSGDDFTDGETRFCDIAETFRGAGPHELQWSGSTGDAYRELCQTLSALAQTMQETDRQTATVVQRQADQVQKLREELAATKLSLVGVLVLTAALAGGTFAYMGSEAGVGARTNNLLDGLLRDSSLCESSASVSLRPTDIEAARRSEGIGGNVLSTAKFLDEWLPLIVLPPCIGAITAASVFFDQLINDGETNGDDMQERSAAYQRVATVAAGLFCDTAPISMTVPAASAIPSAPVYRSFSAADIPVAWGTPTSSGMVGGSVAKRDSWEAVIDHSRPVDSTNAMLGQLPWVLARSEKAAGGQATYSGVLVSHDEPRDEPATRMLAPEDVERLGAAPGVWRVPGGPAEIAVGHGELLQETTGTTQHG